MIDARRLRKEFNTRVAVDDVSFTVRPGEIYGLIGPNGAGKSTTIRMIMNILRPDRGEVWIGGKPVTEATKNILGYLPEERGLYRKNKLLNTITYFGRLKGLSAAEARRRGARLLDRLQLGQYAAHRIEELSKGNQQKVQFIISVLHDPPVLVLDELFSGFDPLNQELMKDTLLDLKRQNRAIIFSTHQMDHAEKLCDDLCLIDRGKTVLTGSPASIRERYGKNWVRVRFQGTPPYFGGLAGVSHANLFGTQAELQLEPNVPPNAILQQLLPRVTIDAFERIEPSLHAIFIDVVGGERANGGEEGAPAPKEGPRLASQDTRLRMTFLALALFVVATVVAFASAAGNAHPSWTTPLIFLAGTAAIAGRFAAQRKRIRERLRGQTEGNGR